MVRDQLGLLRRVQLVSVQLYFERLVLHGSAAQCSAMLKGGRPQVRCHIPEWGQRGKRGGGDPMKAANDIMQSKKNLLSQMSGGDGIGLGLQE